MRLPAILALAPTVVIAAADIVIDAASLARGATGAWCVAEIEGGRHALHHPSSKQCRHHEVTPGLDGWHRIYVTTHRPRGASPWFEAAGKVRLDNLRWRAVFGQRHGLVEDEYLAADMTGRRLVFSTIEDRPAFFVQVRFVPMSPEEVAAERAERERPPERELHGINDADDWFWLYSSRDAMSVFDQIGQHKAVGCNRMYWINGAGALTYESKLERRYPGEKSRPQTMRSAWMTANIPILASACRYAHEQGMQLWAWYRMNNEFGDGYEKALNSEFFNTKPQFREKAKNGQLDGGRLSFAFPEVRAYKRAVCCEMIGLGCDGLLLGALRHPPMLLWADPICDGFRDRHGVDPRTLKPGDPRMQDFYRFRAGFMTTFLRELREDLRRMGCADTPISLRIAIDGLDRNMRDGFDVSTLVAEGLVQELCLHANYLRNRVYEPYTVPERLKPYMELVHGTSVRVFGAIDGGVSTSPRSLISYARFFHGAGAEGFAIYESDTVFIDPALRPTLRRLSRRQTLTAPYFTASSSWHEGLIPWTPDVGDTAPFLQLCFPAPVDIDSVVLDAASDAGCTVAASRDGTSFDELRVSATERVVRAEVHGSVHALKFKPTRPSSLGQPVVAAGELSLADGNTIRFGPVSDSTLRLTSPPDGETVRGSVHALARFEGGDSGTVLFFLDDFLVRTERAAPYEWFFDSRQFDDGEHTLRVQLADRMALTVPTDEITVRIDNGPQAPAREPAWPGVPRYRADFARIPAGSIHGRDGWEVLRRTADMTFLPADAGDILARVERRRAGIGSLDILSRGTPSSAWVVRKRLERPIAKGFLDMTFRMPKPGRKTCLILGEADELCIVVYLAVRGEIGYQGDGQNGPPLPTPSPLLAGRWNRLRVVWDAATDTTDIYVNDTVTPRGTGLGQRRPLKAGVDSAAFYFWPDQADALSISQFVIGDAAQ